MSVRFEGGRKRNSSAIYIAIGLCCAAVCLVGISTFINSRAEKNASAVENYLTQPVGDEWLGEEVPTEEIITVDADPAQTETEGEEGSLPDNPEGDSEAAVFSDDAVEASAQVSEQETQPTEDASEGDTVQAAKKTATRPMSGKITNKFSGDELVFCSTMCDWRVHEGIDIAGDMGGAVYAARAGVIFDVVEDVLYGHTVIVRHSDESMLYYCGLSSTPLVSKGMEVKAGDVIGMLDIVPCEAGE